MRDFLAQVTQDIPALNVHGSVYSEWRADLWQKQSAARRRQGPKDFEVELAALGSGADFVDHCAKELPIRTLSDMVGIPESERLQVAHAADAMVSWADAVYLDGRNPLEVLVDVWSAEGQRTNDTVLALRRHPAVLPTSGEAGSPSSEAGGGPVCPYTGPPLVDPTTFPDCSPACGGSHCVPSSLVPPAQQAQLQPAAA